MGLEPYGTREVVIGPVKDFVTLHQLSLRRGGKQIVQGNAGDRGGAVTDRVGKDDVPAMEHRAAAVNHVGDIAFPLSPLPDAVGARGDDR